jgi:hypothetical protein
LPEANQIDAKTVGCIPQIEAQLAKAVVKK